MCPRECAGLKVKNHVLYSNVGIFSQFNPGWHKMFHFLGTQKPKQKFPAESSTRKFTFWGIFGHISPYSAVVNFLHFTLPKRLEIAFPAGLSAENSGTDIGSLYVYSRTKFYIINTIFGIEIGRASWDLAFLPGHGVPACPNILPPWLKGKQFISITLFFFS